MPEPTNTNKLFINGNSTEYANIYLRNYGKISASSDFDTLVGDPVYDYFLLITDGQLFEGVWNDSLSDDFTWQVDFAFASTELLIPNKIYNFEYEPKAAMTEKTYLENGKISSGFYIRNIKVETGTIVNPGIMSMDIQSGTLEVSLSSDNKLNLNFELNYKDGNHIKGSLKMVAYSL